MNAPSLIPTRGTDERFAIRHIIDTRYRGWSILVGFFTGTIVGEADLNFVYHGRPIAEEKWIVIIKTLAERMPRE